MSDRFGNISISREERKKTNDSKPAPERSKRVNKSSPKKGSGKVILLFLIPVLLFGLYCGVGFYIIPAFITEKLPTIIEKKYNIKTSVESSTFNPLDFRLTLQNISIKHDTHDALNTEFLFIKNANLSLSLLSLIRSNFVCENITLSSPKLSLIRSQDGSYNVSKYIDINRNTSTSEIMDFAELPFLFSLNNVTVTEGEILFQDKPSNKTHTVKDISLGIPTLSNFFYETQKSVIPHFSAIVNGSPLEILSQPSDLSKNEKTDSTDRFTIELESFNLPQYIEYLPFSLPLQILEGSGKGKVELSFSTNEGGKEKLTAHFQLQLDNLETISEDKSFTAQIKSSQILGTYHPVTNELRFDNIYVQEPAIKLTESFSTDSIYTTFFKESENSVTKLQQSPTTTLFVNRMLIDGGSFSKNLTGMDSPAVSHWEEIQFALKDFTNISFDPDEIQKNRGSFRLSGEQQNSRAAFVWNGEMNSNGEPTGHLKISDTPASDICKYLWQDSAECSTGTANLDGKLTIHTSGADNSINERLGYSLNDADIELQKVRFIEKDRVWLYAEQTKISIKDFGVESTNISKLSIIGANIHLHQYFIPKLISKYTLKGGTPLTLGDINIHGVLTVHNSNNATPLIIENFSLKNIGSNKKDSQQSLLITGSTPSDGEITAKGTIQFSPLSCSFSTEFQNLASEQLLPLFSKNPIAINSKTHLSGKGVYKFPQSSFIGSLRTNSAEIIGTKKLLHWNSSTFTDMSYKAQPFHIGVKKIDIHTPSFTWTREVESKSPYDSLSSFFNNLFPTHNLSKKRQKEKLPYYKIDQINVFQGKISIADNRSQKASLQFITDITGNFSDILSPISSQETSFVFSGNKDNTPFSLSGKGDLLTSPSNGNATYSFSNITQSDVLDDSSKNIFYLKDFSTEGVVHSEWFDNQTINKVDLSIKGLLPHSPSSTEALTLAFLYKENPHFYLKYNQKVTSETPSTSLMNAGIANFKTRLIKSQISPILLAEEDYSDLIDAQSLEFKPGASTLTGETRELLTRFSSLLTSYPLLAITLQGQINIIEDKKTINKDLFEKEQQRVLAENDRLFKEWQKESAKISAQKENEFIENSNGEIIEGNLDEPTIHEFIPLVPKPVLVSNNLLSMLATERAKAVYDFLVSEIKVPVKQLHIEGFTIRKKELLKNSGVKISLTTLFPPNTQQDDIETIFNNSDQ